MGRRGLAAGAIALGAAGFLAAAGPRASTPASAAFALAGVLGPGAAEALLAAPPPTLRFSVPAGGHASLRLGFSTGGARERAVVELALVALLGVPGVWPLDGARGLAEAGPAPETDAAPVPEPGSVALLGLGVACLAGARALRPRRPAGRDAAPLAP